ncbi:hypothetical protein ANN_13269 [Periplaneta americana]|uniref:HTH CENPB-type domain-containing protein n=1 Tax=Periplaneta americana TaxID=6978 RepID=A0ABQ8TKS2_PERAM|nr:hypothetical protein ANN_13269 [Periplaneta americana]
MCNQLKVLANLFYGLTPNDVKRAAFEFAEANKIKHPFSKETKMAGRYWLQGFLKRNSSLSLRKPEAIQIIITLIFTQPHHKCNVAAQSTVSAAVNETPGEISISTNLDEISPGPSTSNNRRSGGRKKQHSEILTSSPMKKKCEAKKQKKLSQKEQKKYEPKRSAAKRSDAKKKLPKKFFESSS